MIERSGSAAVALTFDDGPDPHSTPRLLDLLAELDVPATFFPISARARAHREIVQRMLEQGHRVGLHGALHLRHSTFPDDLLELDTRLAIEWLAHEDLRLWRPPWGLCTDTTRALAARHGLTLVGWTLDSGDWQRGRGAAEMLADLAPRLCPGAVILMHDGVGPGRRDPDGGVRDDCESTLELVPALVAEIRAAGLSVGPISA